MIKKWQVEGTITKAVHEAMLAAVTVERQMGGLGRFEPSQEGAKRFVDNALDALASMGLVFDKTDKLVIQRNVGGAER